MKRIPITNELLYGKEGQPGDNPYLPKIMELMEGYEIEMDSGIEEMLTHYSDNAAPASAGHHNNCIWGLWGHLYNVIWWALHLNGRLDNPYPNDVVFKVALGHDNSKFENAPVPASLKRDGNFREKFWEYINADVYEAHEITSLIYMQKYIPCDKLMRNAIEYHHGRFSKDLQTDQYIKKDVMSGLAYLLHIADLIASQLIEPTYYAGGE